MFIQILRKIEACETTPTQWRHSQGYSLRKKEIGVVMEPFDSQRELRVGLIQ
jgi:hypothetical protein